MKKRFMIPIAVAVIFLATGAFFSYKAYRQYMTIETIRIDPYCTVYLGGGGNSMALIAEDHSKTLLVDTKMGIAAKELKKEITDTNVIIVNTHNHRDHVEGNALYLHAKLIAGAYTPQDWFRGAKTGRYPDETVNTGEEKIIRIGSETVHIRNMGQAHTKNDVVVYCERRKLLMTGDIVFLGTHPVLFSQSGCNIASWITVLDSLKNRYDATCVIPGHGKITDGRGITAMKEYFVSIDSSIGHPEMQAQLQKRYKNYFSIPGMSSFEKTLDFIRSQREGK